MWNLVSHTIFRCPVSMHKNINHECLQLLNCDDIQGITDRTSDILDAPVTGPVPVTDGRFAFMEFVCRLEPGTILYIGGVVDYHF